MARRGAARDGRARRGDIRFALLSALTDGPAHGYEIIQRLEERTGGRWKPSLCKSCPVPDILRQNACPNMALEARVNKTLLGLREEVLHFDFPVQDAPKQK